MTLAGRPTAVGAYIFAGGFTLGVAEHFNVLAHLEGDGYGASTAKLNWPDLPIHIGPERWPTSELKAHGVDFVYSNPPCAIFSRMGSSLKRGFGNAWRHDPRTSCWWNCLRLLKELEPQVWVLESVSEAWVHGKELIYELTRQALALSYSATFLLVDARWYGLCQKRPRFFLIFHRGALAVNALNWSEQPTLGEALAEVASPGYHTPVTPEFFRTWHVANQGESMRSAWERANPEETWQYNHLGHVKGRPGFIYRKAKIDAPFKVFYGDACLHPTEPRHLGINEAKVICGFPDDFKLAGPQTGWMSLLARGVMPPVARWLAASVASSLSAPPRARDELRVTLVDLRLPGIAPVDLTNDFVQRELPRIRIKAITRPYVPEQLQPEMELPTVAMPAILDDHDVGGTLPSPNPGEKSGAYIQRLWLAGYTDPDALAAAVRQHWEGRTTTRADVYFNYRKLLDARAPGLIPWPGRRVPRAPDPSEIAVVTPSVIQTGLAVTVAETSEPVAVTVDGLQPVHGNKAGTARAAARDPERLDTTSLTERSHGYRVHRDYAAHFFRWGFTARHISTGDTVLDVGCGTDFPFVKTLVGAYPSNLPSRYVGVDLNALSKPPTRPWVTFHGNFNFTERYAELGQFSKILCLEAIEHMPMAAGERLLLGMRACLEPGGTLYLSTPVFDGHAAVNHVHEYTIPELAALIEKTGLVIKRRFGTFANYRDIKRVATPDQVALLDALHAYYPTDVTACFLAPLYPDAARNNLWVLQAT